MVPSADNIINLDNFVTLHQVIEFGYAGCPYLRYAGHSFETMTAGVIFNLPAYSGFVQVFASYKHFDIRIRIMYLIDISLTDWYQLSGTVNNL